MKTNILRTRSIILGLGLFCSGLLISCQQEPQPSATEQSQTEQLPYVAQLSLGSIPLEDQPQTVALEGEVQQSRSLDLKVNQDKLPTLVVSPDKDASGKELKSTPFPVYIALRSNSQTVYGRANWKLVRDPKDGKMYVEADGSLQLNAEPNVTGLNQGDDTTWHLYAYYFTGSASWDATNHTITFKQSHRPTRLYGDGQVLRLGRDLDVPFSLGYKDASGKRINGIPMRFNGKKGTGEALFDTKQVSSGTAGQTSSLATSFRMVGSLYSIRLKNAMPRNEAWPGTSLDKHFLGQGAYRPSYDYSVRGFYIESTNSSDEGKIDLTRLASSAAGTATPWQPLQAVSLQSPIRIDMPLNKADSVQLDRGTTSPTLLFWLKDFDESTTINSSTAKGEGLGLWANLYNKTISRHMGMTQVLHSEKTHKSGFAYRSTLGLVDELRLNPLARMGYDFISGTPRAAGTGVTNAWFALNAADNGMKPTTTTPGAGQSYTYRELMNYNDLIFYVNYPQVLGTGSFSQVGAIQSRLQWQIPDQYDLWSVFPTEGWDRSGLTQANAKGWVTGNTMKTVHDEDVRLDGWRQKYLSVYYRRDSYHDMNMSRHRSRNTFYALRFVGTPYMVAYRYTERGKWYNPNVGAKLVDGSQPDEPSWNNGAYPNALSRLVIEAKSLGHLRNRIKDARTAEAYIREVVAKDDFWGDKINQQQFYETSTERSRGEIIARELHVNGNPNAGSNAYIGGLMYIWTRKRDDNLTQASGKTAVGGVFQDRLIRDKPLTWHGATALERGANGLRTNFTANILPWLSIKQD